MKTQKQNLRAVCINIQRSSGRARFSLDAVTNLEEEELIYQE